MLTKHYSLNRLNIVTTDRIASEMNMRSIWDDRLETPDTKQLCSERCDDRFDR